MSAAVHWGMKTSTFQLTAAAPHWMNLKKMKLTIEQSRKTLSSLEDSATTMEIK
jgi:hypothetical protein